ncbi:MAG: MarR family winged helix-turn-helix transcriptional regulator [Anaeroplasmataceae bacterium]
MEKRQQAINLLEEFRKSRPPMLFDELDNYERGINFVLGYLSQQKGEVISSDLSNALNVSTARMTKILSSMEKKDLIKKEHSSADGRKIIVVLTKKGKDTTEKFKDALIDVMVQMIERVGYDNLMEFINISYKMKAVMEEINLLGITIK